MITVKVDEEEGESLATSARMMGVRLKVVVFRERPATPYEKKQDPSLRATSGWAETVEIRFSELEPTVHVNRVLCDKK